MKNIIRLAIINTVLILLVISCNQPYYSIPTGPNGDPIITDIGWAKSVGITMLDDQFTVKTYLPNAHPGDVMTVTLLNLQIPPNGGSGSGKALFPISGTQREVTVDSDLKLTVTYSRGSAELQKPGDYVLVTFGGKTASNQLKVEMEKAISVSNPKYKNKNVTVTRSAGTAYFTVKVNPVIGNFSSQVVTVKEKNGINSQWKKSSYTYNDSVKVPISGSDFAVSDTMYYLFIGERTAPNSGKILADSATAKVVIQEPTFFFSKSASISNASSGQKGGINLLNGNIVSDSDNHAILTVSIENGSIIMKGGSNWTTGGKSISFVPSNNNMYSKNNSKLAIEAYNNGNSISKIEPNAAHHIYIFKIDSGSDPSDIYFGLLKITNIDPATGEIVFSYRIGNRYEDLLTLEL